VSAAAVRPAVAITERMTSAAASLSGQRIQVRWFFILNQRENGGYSLPVQQQTALARAHLIYLNSLP
jgi:hypothetical protein